MTGDGRDWREIAEKAGTLPEDRFLRVVRLFEHVRNDPGVAEAMASLRPRLAVLRPPRRMTPERLFFLPIEDLLDDGDRYRRRQSRISRTILTMCWQLVEKSLPQVLVDETTVGLAGGTRLDSAVLVKLGTPLWTRGAQILGDELKRADKDLKYKTRVFGRDDDVIRQLVLVRQLLAIGPAVETLKAALPTKPIISFTEFHIDSIRETVQEVSAKGVPYATALLLVMAARMLRPGDLLAMLADFDMPFGRDDCATMVQDVGVATMENLLREAADLPSLMEQADRAEQVAAAAERLVDGLESLQKRLDGASWRKMSSKVEATRKTIATALRQTMIEPSGEMLLSTQVQENTLDRETRRRQVNQAERFALAFRRALRVAPFGGVKDEMDAKAQEFCKDVRSLADKLTPGINDLGKWDEEQQAAMDSRIVTLLRLVEIMAGPEAADEILTGWEERMSKVPWMSGN